MVLKTISQGCGVRASLMLFFINPHKGGGGGKVVGVPQPKPMHGFSPNFHMFTPTGSRVGLGFGGIWQQLVPCHANVK